MRALVVHTMTHPNDSQLSKEAVRVAMQRALLQKSIRVSNATIHQSPAVAAALDSEDLL